MVPSEDNKGIPKHWPWWRLTMAGLIVIALILTIIMSWHFMTEGSIAGCGGGSPCEQVLSSRWSNIGGILPVSGLAAGVYLAMLIAVFFIGPSSETPVRSMSWGVMLILAGAIAGSAIWFMVLQKWIVGDFCPWCIATHTTGLLLAALITQQAVRYFKEQNIKPFAVLPRLLAGLLAAGLLVISQVILAPEIVYNAGESEENVIAIDYRNTPVIGPPDAPYVVTLLFDYQCSHCQKLHFMLAEVVSRYSGKLAFALCPVPLNHRCNPYVPDGNDEFINSCELAETGLAVWLADRDVFPDFENYMFTFESGNHWQPRSPEAARTKAADLVGKEEFETALADPRIDSLLQSATSIYGQTLQNGMGGIPKLVFGSRWVIPRLDSPDEFITILQNTLGVPGP